MNAVTRSTVPHPLRDFLRKPDVAMQLRSLRQHSIGHFIAGVVLDYALIIAAIGAVLTTASSPLVAPVYLIAIVVIAARQHALLVLMHEGAHRNISKNRSLNDLLADLLCGAPLFISTRSYRSAHLTHHQYLNTQSDPDWCRKTDNASERAEWTFPASVSLPVLLASLYTRSITYLLKSLADNQPAKPDDSQAAVELDNAGTIEADAATGAALSDRALKRARLGLYAGLAISFSLLFSPLGFLLGALLFWFVPMLLVLPLIMRIRSIAEHFALRHDHPLRESRTVRAPWVERLLLAPHHIGIHIDHHIFASVPFHNLPALHQLLMQNDYYRENAQLNDGYFVRRRFASRAFPGSVGKGRATLAEDMYSERSERLEAVPAN